MNKLFTTIFAGVLVAFPAVASAETLAYTIATFSNIVNGLIPIVLAVAVLVFFWGLAMYLTKTGSDEERKKAINVMFMGIIAIFVMVSIWGIIRVLQETFKVESGSPIVPQPIESRI